MNKQEKILRELAEKHQISLTEAFQVWSSFCSMIEITLSANKKTDGLFDSEKFKTIHVDHLGKFKPNYFAIKKANGVIKKKKDGECDNI